MRTMPSHDRHEADLIADTRAVRERRCSTRLHGLLLTILAVAVTMAATGCAAPQRPGYAPPQRVVPAPPGAPGSWVKSGEAPAQSLEAVMGAQSTDSGPAGLILPAPTNATAPASGPAATNATAAPPATSRFDAPGGRRVPMSPSAIDAVRTARMKELRKAPATATTVTKDGRAFTVPLSSSQIRGQRTFGGYTEAIIKPNDDFAHYPERITEYKHTDNMGAIPFMAPFFTVQCRNGRMGKEIYFHNRTGTDLWCIEDKWSLGSFCYESKAEVLDIACAEAEAVTSTEQATPATTAPETSDATTPPDNQDSPPVASAPAPVAPGDKGAEAADISEPAAEISSGQTGAMPQDEDTQSGVFSFMKALIGL